MGYDLIVRSSEETSSMANVTCEYVREDVRKCMKGKGRRGLRGINPSLVTPLDSDAAVK